MIEGFKIVYDVDMVNLWKLFCIDEDKLDFDFPTLITESGRPRRSKRRYQF